MKWADLGALFTPTEKTKLAGIEDGATADQIDAEIRDAVEAATNSNTFTDADHIKLNGVQAAADVTDTTNVLASGSINSVEVWIEYTDNYTEIAVGTIPANSFIIRTYIQVTELFDDGGSDNLSIGINGTLQKFATDTDVSTTGVKDPTRGAGIGYNSGAQSVVGYYHGGMLNATQGKALAVIEYYTVPAQP